MTGVKLQELALVLINTSTEDYQEWPTCFLSILYAYEMWKDGAEMDCVLLLLNDCYNKNYLIKQLQDVFNYPKEN